MTAPLRPVPVEDAWAPIDLAPWLDGTHVPEVPSVLCRLDGRALMYPGRVHSVYGEPESGKSMVVQAEAAVQLVAGRRVVYLDYESDASTVTTRLLALGVTAEQILKCLTYIRPEKDPHGTGWESLLTQRAAMFVIDGVTEALTVSSVSSKDNDEVTGWLRRVAKRAAESTGAAVVLVDHVTKGEEGRGRFPLGAQAKLSAMTGSSFLVEVDQPLGRGMVGVLHLRVSKDRPGSVRPHCGPYRKSDRTQLAAVVTVDSRQPDCIDVRIDGPEAGRPLTTGPFRPTTLMERISRAIEAHDTPMSVRQIREAVSGQNRAKDTALETLIAEEFVTTESGPRNARMHTTAKPYRADDDPASDSFTGGARWDDATVPESECDRAPAKAGGHGARSLTVPGARSGHGRGTVTQDQQPTPEEN